MLKVKICGLTRAADIAAVNAARPDYIGFVFAQSRRRISPETARELRALLAPAIHAVGVFVNERAEEVAGLAHAGVLDAVQLHGDEDAAYIRALRALLPRETPVIKAVRVRDAAQILQADALPCDYLLLDTYDPASAGGVGKTFDWRLIPSGIKPYFLAGGLSCENVARAVRACAPCCVDVSSGVETEGKKDAGKIERFVRLARSV